MSNLQRYADVFFDELEVFEDISRGHSYKVFLRQAVREFLENETKDTAFAVYRTFFDSYRIVLEGDTNPFIDLLDVLNGYEENAATLIDKQRDHYIHSVNVFILGLCIYSQNKNFRTAFDKTNMNKDDYPFSYDTKHEEFFYRWGLASLFHDVGYPIEIIGRQIEKFINFATAVDGNKTKVQSHLEFENFEELNSIAEVTNKRSFTRRYFDKYDSCTYVDLLKPIDLLAHKLHISLGVELKAVKTALDNFIHVMAKSGFVDHGFYSSIIVLKWYGYLIQRCNYKPEYFFYPVLDSASAILLHNYYKNVIMKPPFGLGALHPETHPIAYLLIMCDELQEWNRKAYGILDKKRTHASAASIVISDKRMDISYISNSGTLPEEFSAEKEALFNNLLDMCALFTDGFSVSCESTDPLAPFIIKSTQEKEIVPRPLLDNLEKLAVAIHELYNKIQLERHPEKPLDYPHFSDLPDSMKYSNLRQARSIPDKLALIGYEMLPKSAKGVHLRELTTELVEYLAIIEHDDWVRERLDSGWVYGPVRDRDKKISPFLAPYDDLPEEIKELDRDTIRNIPLLLDMIGMAAHKKS